MSGMNGHEPRTIGNANLKTILLALYDYFMVVVAFALALWIRFDCRYSAIPADEVGAFIWFVPIYAALCVLVFSLFRLYRSVWKFASFMELMHMAFATLILAVVHVVGTIVIFHRMPVAYYILGVTFQFAFTMGIRFIYRFVRLLDHRYERKAGGTLSPVMLIGGGQAGQMILRDIKQAKEISEKVVCIIDDDPAKVGRYIDGIRVVGNRDHILKAAQDFKIQKIYVAIPSASAAERRDILDICKETGAQIKLLPGMYQLVSGEISVQNMRDVRIEDLLGREPIRIATDAILSQLKGKVVLVTGGGGSIGSELCRQIACHEPKQLIILDIYENATYDIQLELKKKHPELDLVTLIGSVRDSRKMFQVFEHYKPDIVYHAAAHKHVPLMEDSPCEAIKNNAFGTYKTAFAAMANGCKRFVLISTDKAVNPTNIMGASKRLCEMVIQSFDRMVKDGRAADVPQLFTHIVKDLSIDEAVLERLKTARTEFVAVRFGNVLGSNGSVVPLFKKQIEMGGPVTVTHPDIIRYFMTIPEAVSLVLQAGGYAHGGEIFVLDMGEPVKIDTLARNFIRLAGFVPDEDIKIEYTGLRPGEKLFEEKLMAEEGLEKTESELIHIGKPISFDVLQFFEQLKDLMEQANNNRANIRETVKKMVVTYHPIVN